jgi:hypothetical protein
MPHAAVEIWKREVRERVSDLDQAAQLSATPSD